MVDVRDVPLRPGMAREADSNKGTTGLSVTTRPDGMQIYEVRDYKGELIQAWETVPGQYSRQIFPPSPNREPAFSLSK